MLLPVWVGTAALLVGFFVAVPVVVVVIGHAAWFGKPKNWDRSMYLTAFAVSIAVSAFLLVYSQRMQADVRTWRYPVQITVLSLGVLLFGVAGGCLVGTFTYRRGRGPIWQRTTRRSENTTNNVAGDQETDE